MRKIAALLGTVLLLCAFHALDQEGEGESEPAAKAPAAEGAPAPAKVFEIKYPCDLTELEFTPTITFYKDMNHDPKDPAERRARNDNLWYKKAAAGQGEFFLGVEGVPNSVDLKGDFVKYYKADAEKVRAFGVEEEFPFNMNSSMANLLKLNYYTNLKIPENYPEANRKALENAFASAEYELLATLSMYPSQMEAWELIQKSRPFEGNAEVLATHIDRLRKVKNEDERNQSITRILGTLELKNDLKAFRSVQAKLVEAFGTLARQKYDGKPNGPDMQVFEDIRLDLADPKKMARWAQVLVRDWRNTQIAANVAKLYCEAALEKKNVVVIMGGDHVPGLVEILARSAGETPPKVIEEFVLPKT